MTETITATEVLKSRQNFSDYIEQNADTVIKNLLKDYPPRPLQIIYPQLTQSSDGLIEIVRQLEGNQKAYIFWFIVNKKEDLKNIALKLNLFFDKNYCGIFIIKAVLNENKIEFEPVLKPELVIKQKREVNTNTPSKQLQKKYWDKYIELCDTSEHPEMQISEALPTQTPILPCVWHSLPISVMYFTVEISTKGKSLLPERSYSRWIKLFIASVILSFLPL